MTKNPTTFIFDDDERTLIVQALAASLDHFTGLHASYTSPSGRPLPPEAAQKLAASRNVLKTLISRFGRLTPGVRMRLSKDNVYWLVNALADYRKANAGTTPRVKRLEARLLPYSPLGLTRD